MGINFNTLDRRLQTLLVHCFLLIDINQLIKEIDSLHIKAIPLL